MRSSPFGWVTERAQPRLLAALTLVLLASSAWLLSMDGELVSPEAPNGIVSYELAGSLAASDAILQSWSERAKSTALLVQGFDYLYLFVYPAWFALGAARLGAALGGAWGSIGSVTSWSVLGAAPLDAIENYALIEQLLHGATALHSRLAWWCAVPKFALVVLAAVFIASAGCVRLARMRSA